MISVLLAGTAAFFLFRAFQPRPRRLPRALRGSRLVVDRRFK